MVFISSLIVAGGVLLATSAKADPVQVKLGRTSFTGVYNTTNGVETFFGIKYANHKRFEHPVLIDYRTGKNNINTTVHAPACSQINNATGWNDYGNVEDCLFLEIYRPHTGITDQKQEKLPVLFWIHGGSGISGSANWFQSQNLVQNSAEIGKPIIVVTINYRLAGWGLLGGKEALENKAVNLALYDQRAALQWVNQNIEAFGGDKEKVTLWGMSWGSLAVNLHYLDENSKLFRGAIMHSGNVNSFPAHDATDYQAGYDGLVKAAGCDTTIDTFTCLKTVDNTVMQNAVNVIYNDAVKYTKGPLGLILDGDIIPDYPSKLVAAGKFAKKPFITGNVMDEGTMFPSPTPMETVDAMWEFFKQLNGGGNWLSNEETKAKLLELYPDDPAMGSPFNTGEETFGFGAEFKRAAAIAGDIRFQAPHRSWFADASKYGVEGWSYSFDQFTPSAYPAAYGVYHTADLPYVFFNIPESQTDEYNLAKDIVGYLITFVHNLDPNYDGAKTWPSYGTEKNSMIYLIGDSSISAVPGERMVSDTSIPSQNSLVTQETRCTNAPVEIFDTNLVRKSVEIIIQSIESIRWYND